MPDVNNGTLLQVVDTPMFTLDGAVTNTSLVVVVNTTGSITVTGNIDQNSSATLKAPNGSVTIAAVDNQSSVEIEAGGDITLNSFVHNSNANLNAHGKVTMGEIDFGATVRALADGDISVSGQINGNEFNHGPSHVELVSNRGSVTITGKIDSKSNVYLTAGQNISIGANSALSDDDRKVDGDSFVTAIAGGNITLGSWIRSGNTVVDLAAAGTVAVTKDISGGAHVRLLGLAATPPQITVSGPISDSSTVVDYWTPSPLTLSGQNSATVSQLPADQPWVPQPAATLPLTGAQAGYWWENWGQTLGYVAPFRVVPKSVDDISLTVSSAGNVDNPTQLTPCKAIGGGWSFSDAVLPFTTQAEVDQVSTLTRGRWQNQDLRNLLEGHSDSTAVQAMDLLPQAVTRNVSFSTMFDQTNLRQVTNSGAQLPASGAVHLIDTRQLASSLQCEFEGIRATSVQPPPGEQRTNIGVAPPPVSAVQPAGGASSIVDHPAPVATMRPAGGPPNVVAAPAPVTTAQEPPGPPNVVAAPAPVTTEQQPAGGAPVDTELLFQVEAGITIADLQQLLDHQSPRLALLASGGSPGATLAGALSTATHGAEFNSSLLVDCVRAVHLVGPGGQQWWIEGDQAVADRAKLLALPRYHAIDPSRFIDSYWSDIPGLTSQDVLKAVVTSMGTMGVIYSVVLAVREQFGLHQVVHPTTWADVLAAAGISEQDLRGTPSATANEAVLNVLTGQTANGTGIATGSNVFANLAINPFVNGDTNRAGNHDCWIVNRELVAVPDDANTGTTGVSDYVSALSQSLTARSQNAGAFGAQIGKPAGRIFDFVSYGTSLSDVTNDISQAGRLVSFITGSGDTFGSALAAVNMQAFLNVLNTSNPPDRGQEFLADVLTGFVHAMEGTGQGQNADGTPGPGINSDATGVSYRVGAIGWPDGGLPGRGLEIALDPANAFSFLQTVLLDDVLVNNMANGNEPLLGYISIRVCPQTQTLMGMQQFSPVSVMIEVVSYRSPQSDELMDTIQTRALAWSQGGIQPLLHWGLENDQVTAGYLTGTPLGQPYKAGLSRLDAFKKIRAYLTHGRAPVFDNNFTARLGL